MGKMAEAPILFIDGHALSMNHVNSEQPIKKHTEEKNHGEILLFF